MRPNRAMSLAVAGMMLVLLASCQQGSTKVPTIGVSKQPPRAMNEELVERPLPPKPKSAQPTEVAIAPTTEEVAPVAVAPAATPTEAPSAKAQASAATRNRQLVRKLLRRRPKPIAGAAW